MSIAIGIGVVLGLIIGGTCTYFGMDRDRALYPAAMIVIAAYYVLFALMGGSTQALVIELAVGMVFVVLALASFKTSLWLVAGAIVGHGIFDVVHPHVYENAGVPWFWPAFCSSIDVVLGAYLAWLLASKRVPVRALSGALLASAGPADGAGVATLTEARPARTREASP